MPWTRELPQIPGRRASSPSHPRGKLRRTGIPQEHFAEESSISGPVSESADRSPLVPRLRCAFSSEPDFGEHSGENDAGEGNEEAVNLYQVLRQSGPSSGASWATSMPRVDNAKKVALGVRKHHEILTFLALSEDGRAEFQQPFDLAVRIFRVEVEM